MWNYLSWPHQSYLSQKYSFGRLILDKMELKVIWGYVSKAGKFVILCSQLFFKHLINYFSFSFNEIVNVHSRGNLFNILQNNKKNNNLHSTHWAKGKCSPNKDAHALRQMDACTNIIVYTMQCYNIRFKQLQDTLAIGPRTGRASTASALQA